MSHIAVSIRNLWYFRNLAPVIEALAQRGHQLDLVCGWDRGESGSEEELRRLVEGYPNIRFIQLEEKNKNLKLKRLNEPHKKWKKDGWYDLDIALSLAIDRLHFRGPIFNQKAILRQRSEAKSAGPLLALADRPLFKREVARKLALGALRRVSEALPPNQLLMGMWREAPPDLLLICPLIDIARPQFDLMRTAASLGIRTSVFVHSWDNLSSKSWLRRAPDSIIVWNDMQRKEVSDFHRLPRAKVHVCGAPHYDAWFDGAPQLSREAFHQELGLDPNEKTILFVGSAVFKPPLTSHFENDFIEGWLQEIRSSEHPSVRNANIILRPHPKRRGELQKLDLSGFERVRIWPPDSENPVSPESRMTYFHSLFHSDAVIGLNTSAFLEAAILRRPVFTVLDPRFESSQRGTFHLEWLLGSEGRSGIIRTAGTCEEHVVALEQCLSGRDPFREEERQFIVDFVRPKGAEKSATLAACEVVEATVALPRLPIRARAVWENRLIRRFVLRRFLGTKLATRLRVSPKPGLEPRGANGDLPESVGVTRERLDGPGPLSRPEAKEPSRVPAE